MGTGLYFISALFKKLSQRKMIAILQTPYKPHYNLRLVYLLPQVVMKSKLFWCTNCIWIDKDLSGKNVGLAKIGDSWVMTLVRVQLKLSSMVVRQPQTTHLRLLSCTTLVEQKSKQTEPAPMSSPINNPAQVWPNIGMNWLGNYFSAMYCEREVS